MERLEMQAACRRGGTLRQAWRDCLGDAILAICRVVFFVYYFTAYPFRWLWHRLLIVCALV